MIERVFKLDVHFNKLRTVIFNVCPVHLRYVNLVWGSLSDTKLETFQRLQNRAFDIIDAARFKGSWERRSLNVHTKYDIQNSEQPMSRNPPQQISGTQETKETCVFKGST